MNSLWAYAAGIRPSSTPGEAGLTNPSHSSSPEIWATHRDYTHTLLHTLNLLNLTRFQVTPLDFAVFADPH